MSDQPVTLPMLVGALTKFHRDVILPDIRRVVQESELRLGDEIHSLFDSLDKRLTRLEEEYHALSAGVGRIESRLDSMDQRLAGIDKRLDGIDQRLGGVEKRLGTVEAALADERSAIRADIRGLRTRIADLETHVAELEARLDRAE